jgi:CHRD domain
VPTEPVAGIGNAHIHSHAKNGAIAVDLATQFTAVAGAVDTYQAIDCVTAPRPVLVDILLHPEQYYVNVHTVDNPGGAVQGDLA